jgi:hypothetical protein
MITASISAPMRSSMTRKSVNRFRAGILLKLVGGVVGVDIAESHDVLPFARHGVHIATAHAADADAGHIQPAVG